MNRSSRLAFSILALALIPLAGWGSEVAGHVRIIGRSGATSVVVYAEKLDGQTPIRPAHRKLIQKNKTFMPALLAIPVGSTVDFPNEDPIFHNIFSLSRPEPFDMGLYRAGASKSRVFSEPATYRVFCNIHPQMTAVILVLPTSWIAETDASGAYRLDLSPGRYRVSAWSERATPASTEVTVSSSGVTVPDLSLNETGSVELAHKNKYGQDYPKNSYDPLKH
jgi:plastocyanin